MILLNQSDNPCVPLCVTTTWPVFLLTNTFDVFELVDLSYSKSLILFGCFSYDAFNSSFKSTTFNLPPLI